VDLNSACLKVLVPVKIDFRFKHRRTGLILFGGGGTILVCPTALLTQYTYKTLFEILSRPFLRIFPWGGGTFLKRDLSVR
jgi:hypothetical protein